MSKYGQKAKSCYRILTVSLYRSKAQDIYKDIAEDVETTFDTSNLKVKGTIFLRKS